MITPERLAASGSEHGHQAALFCWANLNKHIHPELALMFSVPNGGLRSTKTASRMKAEGVRPGVPDIFLPVARGNYHGLFIEMKNERGHVTAEQRKWLNDLRAQGYAVEVCFSWEAAVNILCVYLVQY